MKKKKLEKEIAKLKVKIAGLYVEIDRIKSRLPEKTVTFKRWNPLPEITETYETGKDKHEGTDQ